MLVVEKLERNENEMRREEEVLGTGNSCKDVCYRHDYHFCDMVLGDEELAWLGK